MITSGWKNVLEFMYLISKEEEKNKCYVKVCIFESFKNFTKLLASLVLIIFRIFFTRRALKGHSGTQGNWPPGHSKHSGTRRTLRLLSTQHV